MKPLWTVCLIARNESKTLPRLVKSLEQFTSLGWEIVVVDTWSTDWTPDVARELGCEVHEVGNKFNYTFTKSMARRVNKFIEGLEAPLAQEWDVIFNFADARNYAASLCKTDWISMPDCDEIFTALNINVVNSVIEKWDVDQLEYEFIFAHDEYGKPTIQFRHSKFYDKTKMERRGIVHEVLYTLKDDKLAANPFYLDDTMIKLEHFQNPETNRSQYLWGLALDLHQNPNNDRNTHYLAREFWYTGRYVSAIELFKKHTKMEGAWNTEQAQSYLFMGDSYLALWQEEEAVAHYMIWLAKEPNRREPYIKLARYYLDRWQYELARMFAEGALNINYPVNFYANNEVNYREEPHVILYTSLWHLWKKEEGKKHFLMALGYNSNLQSDRQWFS